MDSNTHVEASARGRFDALQYSFFSGVEDEGGTLERGLEEDLDIAPDEGTLAEEFMSCDNFPDAWGGPRSSSGASAQTNGENGWPSLERGDGYIHNNLPPREDQFLSVTELENQFRAQTLAPPPGPNGALTVSELEAQLCSQAKGSVRPVSPRNGEHSGTQVHFPSILGFPNSGPDFSADLHHRSNFAMPSNFNHPRYQHQTRDSGLSASPHIDLPSQRHLGTQLPPPQYGAPTNQFLPSFSHEYEHGHFSNVRNAPVNPHGPRMRQGLDPGVSPGIGPTRAPFADDFGVQAGGNSSFQQPWYNQPNMMELGLKGLRSGHGGQGNAPGRFSPRDYEPSQFKCMSQVEIGRILSFQAQNLQFSNPYIDDYYFQAHAKKHQKGLNRFAPAMLRLRDPSMKQGRAEVRFADLEGLGKIPFSNLRTPRPLIDFAEEQPEASLTDNDGNTAQTAGTRSIKPLHMEQMLHARKVIEDCMCVLLDVDDIDRTLEEDFGKVDISDLAKRRAELVCSVVGAFPGASGNKAKGKGSDDIVHNIDGVFLRLMSLVKGRTMYAKLLSTLVPPPLLRNVPPPEASSTEPSLSDASIQMCCMVLRNIRALFGPPTWITKQGLDLHKVALTEATSSIASKALDVIATLETSADVSLCFESLAKGDLGPVDGASITPEDLLLPFLPPFHNPLMPCPCWLEALLVSLLLKSKEVGLENDVHALNVVSRETAIRWQWAFDMLYRAITAHLQVLVQVHKEAIVQNKPEALTYAKGLLGKELLTATLTLCDRQQRTKVKEVVGQLTERG